MFGVGPTLPVVTELPSTWVLTAGVTGVYKAAHLSSGNTPAPGDWELQAGSPDIPVIPSGQGDLASIDLPESGNGTTYLNDEGAFTEPPADGGSTAPVSKTVAEMQALVGSFVPYTYYLITDANKTDLGVLVRAATADSLENAGSGGFLNADFQKVGVYSGVPSFGQNRGVWTAADEGDYDDGDVVIFTNNAGLLVQFVVTDTGSLDGTEPASSANYSELSKSTNHGYIEEWDAVIYDLVNNWLGARRDRRGNVFDCSFAGFGETGVSMQDFQWGNDLVFENVMLAGSLVCLTNKGTIYENLISQEAGMRADNNSGDIHYVIVTNEASLNAISNKGLIKSCSVRDGGAIDASTNEGSLLHLSVQQSYTLTANLGIGETLENKSYPPITSLTESSGPTELAIGAVADGEFVKRDGATLIGAAPSVPGAARWIGPWTIYGLQQQTIDPAGVGGGAGLDAGACTYLFNGQETTAIPFDAQAGDYQSAFEALSSVGIGKVVCTGSGPNRFVFDQSIIPTLIVVGTNTLSIASAPVTPDIYITEPPEGQDLRTIQAGEFLIDAFIARVQAFASGGECYFDIDGQGDWDGPLLSTLRLDVVDVNGDGEFSGNQSAGASYMSTISACESAKGVTGNNSVPKFMGAVGKSLQINLQSIGGTGNTTGIVKVWICVATPVAP